LHVRSTVLPFTGKALEALKNQDAREGRSAPVCETGADAFSGRAFGGIRRSTSKRGSTMIRQSI
jgi:hypothetical protein